MALSLLPVPLVESEASYEAPGEKAPHVDANRIECNCVRFANRLDSRVPLINAEDFTPNSTPQEGAFALFYYPHSGQSHIGYIEEVQADGFITYDANYVACSSTRRFVAWSSNSIKGFWSAEGGSP